MARQLLEVSKASATIRDASLNVSTAQRAVIHRRLGELRTLSASSGLLRWMGPPEQAQPGVSKPCRTALGAAFRAFFEKRGGIDRAWQQRRHRMQCVRQAIPCAADGSQGWARMPALRQDAPLFGKKKGDPVHVEAVEQDPPHSSERG
jgi:hypothetical protein